MTVRGDLAAYLVSTKKLTWEEAVDMVNQVLCAADDPNFALRFAVMQEVGTDDESISEEMCAYWDVIKFLKWTNE